METKYYYNSNNFKLILGDSLKVLKRIEFHSIGMIFAGLPYFLFGDGISCNSGKMISVNKGIWDKKVSALLADRLCWDNKDKNQFQKGLRNIDYLLNYHFAKYGILEKIVKEYLKQYVPFIDKIFLLNIFISLTILKGRKENKNFYFRFYFFIQRNYLIRSNHYL